MTTQNIFIFIFTVPNTFHIKISIVRLCTISSILFFSNYEINRPIRNVKSSCIVWEPLVTNETSAPPTSWEISTYAGKFLHHPLIFIRRRWTNWMSTTPLCLHPSNRILRLRKMSCCETWFWVVVLKPHCRNRSTFTDSLLEVWGEI